MRITITEPRTPPSRAYEHECFSMIDCIFFTPPSVFSISPSEYVSSSVVASIVAVVVVVAVSIVVVAVTMVVAVAGVLKDLQTAVEIASSNTALKQQL